MINLSSSQTAAIHRALKVARPAAEPIYTDGDSLVFSEGGRMFLCEVRNAAASLGRYVPMLRKMADIGRDTGPGVARRSEQDTRTELLAFSRLVDRAMLAEADRSYAMPKASAWDPEPTSPEDLKLRPLRRLDIDLDGAGYAMPKASDWDPDIEPYTEGDVLGRLRPGAPLVSAEADAFLPKLGDWL